MAKEAGIGPRIAEQVRTESEALKSCLFRCGDRSSFPRALELFKKDGSIVLSAGSMFTTAETMQAWDKITNMSLRAKRSNLK